MGWKLAARFAVALTAALSCRAHNMSMSTGDASLQAAELNYTLTMPLYEIAHTAHPEQALLEHVTFADARLTSHECHAEPARESYVCHAVYRFATPPETLSVQCTLFEVTVPNHVHLLRVTYGSKRGQAAFDSAFTTTVLRFRSPTAWESGLHQAGAAGAAVVTAVTPLLMVLALALSAASWRNLAWLGILFVVGEVTGAVLPWRLSQNFVASAGALAAAYLAVEVLWLPQSLARQIAAGFTGVVAGILLAGLLLADATRQLAGQQVWALAGAAVMCLALLCVAATLVFLRPRARRFAAALNLAASVCWFILLLSR